MSDKPKAHFLEDKLGRRWDLCLSDAFLKTAVGTGLGVLFSVVAFHRRPWPIALGMGTGLGMALSNCQHIMNRDLRVEDGHHKRKGFFFGGKKIVEEEDDYYKIPSANRIKRDIGEGATKVRVHGEKLIDKIEDGLDTAAKKVGDGFKDTVDSSFKKVKRVGDKIEKTTEQVGKHVQGGLINAADHVESAAHKVSSSLKKDH